MTDIDTRFREADHMDVRDLWADISARQPGRLPEPPTRHRVLAVVVGVLVAVAGIITCQFKTRRRRRVLTERKLLWLQKVSQRFPLQQNLSWLPI